MNPESCQFATEVINGIETCCTTVSFLQFPDPNVAQMALYEYVNYPDMIYSSSAVVANSTLVYDIYYIELMKQIQLQKLKN